MAHMKRNLHLNLILFICLFGTSICFAGSSKSSADGNYVAYDNGIVRDKSTGLEWVSGSDKDTTWIEANSWVEGLNTDGSGWRLPTIDELEGLYKKGSGDRNMTPLLKTSGWWIWASEQKGDSGARSFHFNRGRKCWGYKDKGDNSRAFAVRAVKD